MLLSDGNMRDAPQPVDRGRRDQLKRLLLLLLLVQVRRGRCQRRRRRGPSMARPSAATVNEPFTGPVVQTKAETHVTSLVRAARRRLRARSARSSRAASLEPTLHPVRQHRGRPEPVRQRSRGGPEIATIVRAHAVDGGPEHVHPLLAPAPRLASLCRIVVRAALPHVHGPDVRHRSSPILPGRNVHHPRSGQQTPDLLHVAVRVGGPPRQHHARRRQHARVRGAGTDPLHPRLENVLVPLLEPQRRPVQRGRLAHRVEVHLPRRHAPVTPRQHVAVHRQYHRVPLGSRACHHPLALHRVDDPRRRR